MIQKPTDSSELLESETIPVSHPAGDEPRAPYQSLGRRRPHPGEIEPRVVILNANPERRSSWARALKGHCSVHFVASLFELEEQLDRMRTNAVVAEWQEGLLDCLKRRRPMRLIHCGPVSEEALLDAAGQGIELARFDDETELGEMFWR